MSDIFCRVPCFVAVQKNPVGYKQQLKIAHKEHKLTKIKQSLNTDTDLDTQT